jgi:hypothetical protein
MATRNRCGCGKVMSRYSNGCNSCWAEKQKARVADAVAVVRTGVCPTCGAKLVRNLSMSGWWQCEQLGAVRFRKDPSKPSCSWQVFTE